MSSYEERWHQALLKFHGEIFDGHTKSLRPEFAEHTACPSCGETKHSLHFEKDYFQYLRCAECGLIYMGPRLNDHATLSFYNSDVNQIYNEKKFDEVSSSSLFDDEINFRNLSLIEEKTGAANGRKLLEIGCAKGVFLLAAKKAGFSVTGVELNQKNCEFASKALGGNVYDKDLLELKFADGEFDVIYTRDVIEHIHNPAAFVQECQRILKPGGYVFFETHNIDGLIHRFVGRHHSTIFAFEHPVHWSPKTLGRLFEGKGLKMRHIWFESMDFRLKDIFAYYREPTFTTIIQWRRSAITRFLLRAINKLLHLPVIRQIDNWFFPCLANALHAGSTMKLLAQKPQDRIQS